MNRLKFGIVSLGCDKNRIDTEMVIGNLHNKYELVNNPKEADIILVNTCGFIESSKQESIDTILEMAEYKKKYNCKVLIVTGCLSQRYKEELLDLMPEIDILLGVNNYDKLMESIENFFAEKNRQLYCDYSDNTMNEGSRVLTTPSATAYLRISEGCNNFCTYCVIPKIRGRYRSRKIEVIVEEAKSLANQGVKEIILVAQDTTMYGIDMYGEKTLPKLLKELSSIENIKWIRLLYSYPEEITDELILEIANNDKICKYLDMPIQHVSNSVLKRMNRRGTKEVIIENINKLKKKMPSIALRTSIIVGFPGETDKEFEELMQFVKDIKFDKLGVFKYSQEEGTPAANFEAQISDEIKSEREEALMSIQQKVSKTINESKVGKMYEVLVDGEKNGTYLGRNYEMAPEIDGIIYFTCDTIINKGDLIPVKITEALEYDLIGVVYHESSK